MQYICCVSLWKKDASPNGAYEKALSLLGEGSHTKGEFHTPGNLRVEGSFQGQLRVEGRLVIAPSAEVRGRIHAGQVHIAGRFAGEVLADDSVELAPSAHVQGEIRARRLECHKGATLEVRCFVGEESYQKPMEPELAAPQVAAPQKNRRA